MERTEQITDGFMPASGGWAKVASSILLIIGLIFCVFSTYKIAIVSLALAVVIFIVFALPIVQSVKLFFLYLLFDGAIKVLSNYNPIVHVAQDLFLLSLCVRALTEQNGSFKNWANTPYFNMIMFFSFWVFIQYLNPYSLGILPSLAGTKVYLSGVLLFFLVYHSIRSTEIDAFCTWLVCLGLLEATIALVEYIVFPGQIFSLHPRYRLIAAQRFVGEMYRPFGTTSAPGAPSMWMYLTAPFAVYLLFQAKHAYQKLLGLSLLILATPVLIFCQVRTAMLLFVVLVSSVLAVPSVRLGPKVFLGSLIGLSVYLFSNLVILESIVDTTLNSMNLNMLQRIVVKNRIMSLTETETYKSSRSGAIDQVLSLATKMPFGIGLSRVGAASAPWTSRIAADTEFGDKWSFADNLYCAIFTEIGVFGLFAWVTMVGSVILFLIKSSLQSSVLRRKTLLWTCAMLPLVIMIGGWGSEGVLYMPVSGFFWASFAIGLRECSYV